MFRFHIACVLTAMLIAAVCASPNARGATLIEGSAEAFGSYGQVEFVRYTGRFQGETSLGAFDVPFEIIAPDDPAEGNGVLLFEPPHFNGGPLVRDGVLGRRFLFNRGFSYAAVGFGTNGRNVLDPAAPGIVIAGSPVESPGMIDVVGIADEEIIIQFVGALQADPGAIAMLGPISRTYATGASQTGAALLETLHAPEAQGLFDFTLLNVTLWRPPWEPAQVFERIQGTFEPIEGVGKVIFAESEADQLISDAEQFRAAVGHPDYRVFEIAGAPHSPAPPPNNPLDASSLARALFVAGDQWVRDDAEPPASRLRDAAPAGAIDPIYEIETGIARDADGNAEGGVQLPDVAIGRARFIATLLDVEVIPGVPGLVGGWNDLECEPAADGLARFRFPREYDWRFAIQTLELLRDRLLLTGDAIQMMFAAVDAEIGGAGRCGGEA